MIMIYKKLIKSVVTLKKMKMKMKKNERKMKNDK